MRRRLASWLHQLPRSDSADEHLRSGHTSSDNRKKTLGLVIASSRRKVRTYALLACFRAIKRLNPGWSMYGMLELTEMAMSLHLVFSVNERVP